MLAISFVTRSARVTAAAGLLLVAPPLSAQDGRTADVFRRYSDAVIKVQVVEAGSAAKATIGSGFFVSERGHIVTNYHVISQVVHAPERYRAELVDADSPPRPLRVLALDVVHDLAVLASDARPRTFFDLTRKSVAQGNRLYAMGHPNDLGLSIVEGTYNGHLKHTLYPKIHFTGSINPGMSGGPAISDDGRVIGVNVSTAGNQLSFLIPAEQAAALVSLAVRAGYTPPERQLDEIGRQIRAYQDTYLGDMFAPGGKMVRLGRYHVPTEPASFFRCWADAERRAEQPYEQVTHQCSTDDYVYIAGDQLSGVLELQHQLISTRVLNSARFFALYTEIFQYDNTPAGREEHVTSWRCGTRNVRSQATPMRAVLCIRRYRKLGELYDAVLKVAVLGRGDSGLVSTLTLSGVTFENVDRLSRRYLEQISWQ